MSEAAILSELLSLLPPGDALPQSTDSEIAKVLRVFARSFERLETLADFVVADLDPRSTTKFLEDWERVLGLPDCGSLPATTAERRAEVLEKYTRRGDLTKQSLIDAAAVLGFDISITEYVSPHVDAHIFDVVLASLEVTYFRVGESRTGDSLGSFGDPRLICLLDHRKPAHLNYRLTVP